MACGVLYCSEFFQFGKTAEPQGTSFVTGFSALWPASQGTREHSELLGWKTLPTGRICKLNWNLNSWLKPVRCSSSLSLCSYILSLYFFLSSLSSPVHLPQIGPW